MEDEDYGGLMNCSELEYWGWWRQAGLGAGVIPRYLALAPGIWI
jgi:hypothetical protein